MGRKERWDIPEVFERDILRPVAVKIVESFKKELDPRYFYEIEVIACEDRENGLDRIKITILDGDGEYPERELFLDMEIPENPELVYNILHGDEK